LNDFIHFLSSHDPIWIYVIIFSISFIENIFPPSPSDIIVVVCSAFVAMGKGSFLAALLAGTAGSTVGFVTMYLVGRWFGRRILETRKISFINLETLHKLEQWFVRYSYWIVVVNRFLSGTRAVVSFFAGISELDFTMTTVLSCVSSLLWYGILVFAGYKVGEHWELVGEYLKAYDQVVTILTVVIIGALVTRYFYKKNKSKQSADGRP